MKILQENRFFLADFNEVVTATKNTIKKSVEFYVINK